MGFKCPICMDDFGTDKKSWHKHITTEHDEVGKDILDFVVRQAEVCSCEGEKYFYLQEGIHVRTRCVKPIEE
ncbi:MAG: hypothetical protein KAR40_07995 [Candidatus Sabulitectum sp.]|nr:hypothetical protein [Candidatus Sabulitectum sp.]